MVNSFAVNYISVYIVFPPDLQVPSGPVPCNCSGHLEKIELDQNFPIPAKTLNRLLFGENSPIWKEFHERRNNTGT